MTPLLEQFLSETRECLQGIGEKLMQLEQVTDDAGLMIGLFRLVHTLKGNSGLFDFPEMTRVLHAAEDLMDSVRQGQVPYSQHLADQLLDAMDFVGLLCDDIDGVGCIDTSRVADATRLSEALRALVSSEVTANRTGTAARSSGEAPAHDDTAQPVCMIPIADIPEAARMLAYGRAIRGERPHWIKYTPAGNCFFEGDDPFFRMRQTPDILWGRILAREPWPALCDLDAYLCNLAFEALTSAPYEELAEQFRYVADQVAIVPVQPWDLILPLGLADTAESLADFVIDTLLLVDTGDLSGARLAVETMLQLSNPDLWSSSALRWALQVMEAGPDNHGAVRALIAAIPSQKLPTGQKTNHLARAASRPAAGPTFSEETTAAWADVFAAQRQILMFDDHPAWEQGRLEAVAAVLANCCAAAGDADGRRDVAAALSQSLAQGSTEPLLGWLEARSSVPSFSPRPEGAAPAADPCVGGAPEARAAPADDAPKYGRRAEDNASNAKSLKVDQAKIDFLMNLIGEMVVSKNALPYLAQRAEEEFGVRELAREIKAQYAVINRIAEEMQSAIMQVRMMPVSFVFQRFPRLVRDISRRLGKDVQLVLEGEETEADKNIIESLADPLIHIVRNSLDHGIEMPETRLGAGKAATGTLTIRAIQEGDQVVIEIIDDGKGIDPAVIKRKAYEKGLIDEAVLERISDKDAANLVFAAGFSTAEMVSDLSGRGVGMDVVRTAVEKVNGTILLESVAGKGTRIRISLPLSMAVTKVMIVQSDNQMFGVPMEHVIETVRVPVASIRTIKHSEAIVLRGSVVPLKGLNALLGLSATPKANADDEMAVLVTRVAGMPVGLVVDEFRESVDVIQKPLGGVLEGLAAYSGSALMGNGSVLMVLNVKEIA